MRFSGFYDSFSHHSSNNRVWVGEIWLWKKGRVNFKCWKISFEILLKFIFCDEESTLQAIQNCKFYIFVNFENSWKLFLKTFLCLMIIAPGTESPSSWSQWSGELMPTTWSNLLSDYYSRKLRRCWWKLSIHFSFKNIYDGLTSLRQNLWNFGRVVILFFSDKFLHFADITAGWEGITMLKKLFSST